MKCVALFSRRIIRNSKSTTSFSGISTKIKSYRTTERGCLTSIQLTSTIETVTFMIVHQKWEFLHGVTGFLCIEILFSKKIWLLINSKIMMLKLHCPFFTIKKIVFSQIIGPFWQFIAVKLSRSIRKLRNNLSIRFLKVSSIRMLISQFKKSKLWMIFQK